MPSIGDGGIFSEKPCASPCFFGIRIGETSSEQVTPSLGSQGVAPCYKYEEANIMCGVGFFANVWVTVDLSTSLVHSIGYDPSIPISVADIVEKYGNPNYVWVYSEGIPEFPKLSLSIFWDSIKMEIDLPTIDDNEKHTYSIEESTEIQWITFYDDAVYSVRTLEGDAQSWNGYSVYQP